MKLKTIDNSALLGLFSGLIVCNQSIRSILYVNYISFFFLLLLFSLFYLFFIQTNNKRINLGRVEVSIFILYAFVFLYSLLSLFETGFSNIVYSVDLVILSVLFLAGRLMDLRSLKSLVLMVFIVGCVHSFFLIFYRNYIYASGVNYLLLSLVVGLLSCLSLLAILRGKSLFFRVAGVGGFFLSWFALFSMQSRATFIFSALFLMVIPFAVASNKVRAYYLIISVSICSFFLSYFFSEISFFYENSKIYPRMTDLFLNFNEEQRFTTYGVYFKELSSFYLTGFGVGGTTEGIYSATVEKYPHNFILEFYSEFGVLGLLFSMIFILRALYMSVVSFKYVKTTYWGLAIISVYFFYLMNFMKSFSIYDSSVLFLSVGLVFNRQVFDEIKEAGFSSVRGAGRVT